MRFSSRGGSIILTIDGGIFCIDPPLLGILPGLEERPKIAMDWGLNNLSMVLPNWQFITNNTNGRMIRIFYHFFVIFIRDISKSVTFVINK
jgi:hypothetical protein